MESAFSKNSSAPKFETKDNTPDILRFGLFLLKSRSVVNKNMSQIASELSLGSKSLIQRWEQGNAFPKEDRLSAIAVAYGVDPEELTKFFRVSKEARQSEKSARGRVITKSINR
ncbi:MAG: helix-turn-helix transcriptional regulator [Patescibacteria group bacterium]